MKLAEVVTLYETNASDIAAMLRQAADNIEAESGDADKTRAIVGVQITEDGQVEVYGWGRTELMDSIAVLNMGLFKLNRTACDRGEI